MTNPTPHERDRAIMEGERNASLDAYSRVVLLTSAESRLYEAAFTNGWDRCAAHVQKPAEIEHVAGDVSKNWAESNMSTQPATQQEAQEPVAWYVTGCDQLMGEGEAKAEARHIGGTARAMPLYTAPKPSPTPQADSQPALPEITADCHPNLIAAELRRLHAENGRLASRLKAYEDLDEAASDVQLLRMGYAAARLEIESLQARIKTMRASADSVLEDAALLEEARDALWQPANVALCERIDAYLDAARKQGANHD